MQVTFGTEHFDTGGRWTAGSSVFTADVAGYYQFTVSLAWGGLTDAPNTYEVSLYKNGAFGAGTQVAYVAGANGNSAQDNGVQLTRLIQLAIGDTIQVDVIQESGAAAAQLIDGTEAHSWICGYCVLLI